MLRAAQRLLSCSTAPQLIVEIGFTENFGGTVNQHYAETFNFQFSLDFDCIGVESVARVTKSEIEDWLRKSERTPYALNFHFAPKEVTNAMLAALECCF